MKNFDMQLLALRTWTKKNPIPAPLEAEANSILLQMEEKQTAIFQKSRERRKTKINHQDTLGPGLPFQLEVNSNALPQEKLQFLDTIDRMCKRDQTGIARVTCIDELNDHLQRPFGKPILWRGYAKEPRLHGLPLSIPELLQKLRLLGIDSLEVYNYARTDSNYTETLDNILDHFQAPPGTRDPLNFLDIRNFFASRVPVEINEVDLLRLARRRHGTMPAPESKKSRLHVAPADNSASEPKRSASKSQKLHTLMDAADHEFLLLSSQGSISTLHGDTAGGATFITVISGRKLWYLPRNMDREASEILATFGSSTPETYNGFIKIELLPGDLLIMPPGCPHAVATPEHTLAFGGSFYTLPHLGSSLRVLAIQDRAGTIFSNEDIKEQDLINFIEMLVTCKDLLQENIIPPELLASVVSSSMCWGAVKNKQQRRIQELIQEIQGEIEKRFD
ncbi:hypothetical protein N7453_009662 [Penicillium expansum]|nr:hypothetical protein N7453_009662 [Penicillium expansum]